MVGPPEALTASPVGSATPLCLDESRRLTVSLLQEPLLGLSVNGVLEPGSQGVSSLFLSLPFANVTIDTQRIFVDCLDDARQPLVKQALKELYPFLDKRGRPYGQLEAHRGGRQLRSQGGRARFCRFRSRWAKGFARAYYSGEGGAPRSALTLTKAENASVVSVTLGDGEAHLQVALQTAEDGTQHLRQGHGV